jgi:glycerophosphoryl diester phosphodiesterase
VATTTFAELRARSGIVTLAEVLARVRLPVMVDFTLADVVEPALAAIRGAGALERVLFSGGNVEGHRRVRELAPTAKIALTWTDREPPASGLLEELGVEYFNPPWERVNERIVDAMHGRGYKVSTWTVDDPREMRRVLDCGVDAVITNRIRELVALLSEARC